MVKAWEGTYNQGLGVNQSCGSRTSPGLTLTFKNRQSRAIGIRRTNVGESCLFRFDALYHSCHTEGRGPSFPRCDLPHRFTWAHLCILGARLLFQENIFMFNQDLLRPMELHLTADDVHSPQLPFRIDCQIFWRTISIKSKLTSGIKRKGL